MEGRKRQTDRQQLVRLGKRKLDVIVMSKREKPRDNSSGRERWMRKLRDGETHFERQREKHAGEIKGQRKPAKHRQAGLSLMSIEADHLSILPRVGKVGTDDGGFGFNYVRAQISWKLANLPLSPCL